VRALRGWYRRRVARVDPARLVFADESGANTAMTRSRSRASVGVRAQGAAPQGHWKQLTMLGALRLEGPVAEATIESATDAEVFRLFVTASLAPALRRGDVVVWDNLPAHAAADVGDRLQARGASLLPLPPYSPDLSPIEPAWSKVKQALRTAEARDPVTLAEAAAVAFASITPGDTHGWFGKCGYCAH
jgi:transposase